MCSISRPLCQASLEVLQIQYGKHNAIMQLGYSMHNLSATVLCACCSPLEDHSDHAAAFFSTERKLSILSLIVILQTSVSSIDKPLDKFLLGPVAASDEEKEAGLDKRRDFVAVDIARMLGTIIDWHEGDGIEGTLVENYVEAVLKPAAWAVVEDVPRLETNGLCAVSLVASVMFVPLRLPSSIPLFKYVSRKLHARLTVVHADHFASPILVLAVIFA